MNINRLITKGNREILNDVTAILVKDLQDPQTNDAEAFEIIEDLNLLIQQKVDLVRITESSSMYDGDYTIDRYQSDLSLFELKIDLLKLKYPENNSIVNIKTRLEQDYITQFSDSSIYRTKDLFLVSNRENGRFYYHKKSISNNKILSTYENLFLQVESFFNKKSDAQELTNFWNENKNMFPLDKVNASHCINIMKNVDVNNFVNLDDFPRISYESNQVIEVINFLQDEVAQKLFLHFTVNPQENAQISESMSVFLELYKWLDSSKLELLKNEWTKEHMDVISSYSYVPNYNNFITEVINSSLALDLQSQDETKNKVKL